jgi:carbonic anhydrase
MPTGRVLQGIQRFQRRFERERQAFESLAVGGQAPDTLFIACCDARAGPELITDAEPGTLFVVRSLGNMVPPFGTGDVELGAAVEYAVDHLRVGHIVLCGHTDCGAIRALEAPLDWAREPHMARWIEHGRWAQTTVEARGVPPAKRHVAMVRENVLLQLSHLRSYDVVQDAEQAGALALHGWVYHLLTGSFEMYDVETEAWSRLLGPASEEGDEAWSIGS